VAVGLRLLLERWLERRAANSNTVPAPPDSPVAAAPSAPPVPRVEIVAEPEPTRTPTSALPAARRGAPDEERLRTSQRVILHVMSQGRLPPGEVAPFGLSQAGMGRALEVTQSALAKTLARLVAGGVLTVGRRHVKGEDRRLKVYELTPLGESLARDLRRRAPRFSAPVNGTGTPSSIQIGR
jgi:DNA-binding PadR family transcriptional regulator